MMDIQQVNQLLAVYGDRLPYGALPMVKNQLLTMDYTQATFVLTQLKDTTIAIILSVLVGGLGIDRFYIGDVGLGVLKLITCGGAGIWWLIDIFLIMQATRMNNFEKFRQWTANLQNVYGGDI
jgi:TM2 domain-containing membrane protein YozV